jgi:tetratricopeptide (TPR) repeat protein
MESIARPLRALHEDVSWFARAKEVKLLHVRCDAALRKTALEVMLAGEFHADNRSPYVALEDAWMIADSGWAVRSRRLVEHWEGRRRVTAEEGIELGSLSGQRPASANPLAAFGGWLNLVLQCVRPPLEGLVVVLAPTKVEDPVAFESELRELIQRPELASARWIVADVLEAPLERLHEELGTAAMQSECVRDDDGFAPELSAMMSSVDPELPGPAKAGAAWPREVMPPPRRGDLQPTEQQQAEADIELAAAGVSPALAGAQGQRMQQYMLAAAIHMKQGNGDLAIQHQREACRIADAALATKELVLQWMVLAGYELALGREDEAYRQYAGAAERAEQEELNLERAQAGLALALIDSRAQRHPEAATHYAHAAGFALRADATGLAIECWRLAGHMAAQAQLEERAAECWQRAIALAEDSDPEVAKGSSAPTAARQLAERLRGRGLGPQADALEEQANRLEQGQTRAAMEGLL